MVRIRGHIATIFVLLLSINGSNGTCYANEDRASIKKAKELYIVQTALLSRTTFEVVSHPVFFCQGPESILWEKSIVTRNQDGMVRIDVPVISRDVHMMTLPYIDDKHYYHTLCHHHMTVFLDKKHRQGTIYNHYLIPYRDWGTAHIPPSPLTKDEYIEQFLTAATSTTRNGVEIYSTLDGHIVQFSNFFQGRMVEHATHNDTALYRNQDFQLTIAERLSYIFSRGHILPDENISKVIAECIDTIGGQRAQLNTYGIEGAITYGEAGYRHDITQDKVHIHDDSYLPWDNEISHIQTSKELILPDRFLEHDTRITSAATSRRLHSKELTDEKYVKDIRQAYAKIKTIETIKVTASHPVFFCQAPESILWEKSIVTRNQDGMVRIDVPVISRDVHMMMVPYDDGRSHYQTVCLHFMTVSIDTDSGKQAFFNHYIIPYRSWDHVYKDSPLTDDEYLERFEKVATSQIFNGTEVYSTLDGYIVEFNRYHEGRLYDHATVDTAGRFDRHLTPSHRMASKISALYSKGYIVGTDDDSFYGAFDPYGSWCRENSIFAIKQ